MTHVQQGQGQLEAATRGQCKLVPSQQTWYTMDTKSARLHMDAEAQKAHQYCYIWGHHASSLCRYQHAVIKMIESSWRSSNDAALQTKQARSRDAAGGKPWEAWCPP